MNTQSTDHLKQKSDATQNLWTKDFVLIISINLFLFMGFQFYPAALPPYVKSLGASDATLGWLTGMATISTLITRPLAGVLLDRIGRKWVFLSGLLTMTLISAIMYFFPIVAALLILRFLHGLGWGVASTSSNTIASDLIPKTRFGEGMGYFSLSGGLAMAISPAIALSLAPGPMFFTATALMCISILLAMGLRYSKSASPAQTPKRLTNPYEKAAILPALIMFFITTAYGATVTFLAIFAHSKGVDNIGPFFTVYAVTLMVTRPGAGKIIDKHGLTILILPALILLAISLVALSYADNLMLFLASAVIYGLSMGSLQTSTQTLAIVRSPKNRVGSANATFFTGFDAGIGFGAVIGGVLAGLLGYSGMFLTLAACPLLAAIIFAASTRSNRR